MRSDKGRIIGLFFCCKGHMFEQIIFLNGTVTLVKHLLTRISEEIRDDSMA
jgi:hypothetical protein